MAESTTLNVRMDADTKEAFTSFCDAIGMSASSLMNVFAKTVVRNQEVPFPLTTKPAVAGRYARVFPRDAEGLEAIGLKHQLQDGPRGTLSKELP